MKRLLRTDPEPPPGSVVLLHSMTGTAAQRFYSDGMWHTTGGRCIRSFDALFDRPVPPEGRDVAVFLIHETPKEV